MAINRERCQIFIVRAACSIGLVLLAHIQMRHSTMKGKKRTAFSIVSFDLSQAERVMEMRFSMFLKNNFSIYFYPCDEWRSYQFLTFTSTFFDDVEKAFSSAASGHSYMKEIIFFFFAIPIVQAKKRSDSIREEKGLRHFSLTWNWTPSLSWSGSQFVRIDGAREI